MKTAANKTALFGYRSFSPPTRGQKQSISRSLSVNMGANQRWVTPYSHRRLENEEM